MPARLGGDVLAAARRRRAASTSPARPAPTGADFLYFAMTLGSSFATSDVTVTTTRMRWHGLVHSALSFFYNAVVLAVGFRILTGG
ncbi:DUF1345 domain-containing protein [Arthrobacter sp. UM1]|uniref:DUF1345 domain-containing protein n=1 Tax=Arthrobacter sp. UM1 TaxID=2766776 RepID=UPI001CF6B8A8|nr:DUF1345 domain-containing protein [Arthrobacter sp. UM1]